MWIRMTNVFDRYNACMRSTARTRLKDVVIWLLERRVTVHRN